MMICKADFEELFPETFPPKKPNVVTKITPEPSIACIARWEDDGGRLRSAPPRRLAPAVRPDHHVAEWTDPRLTSAALLMLPFAMLFDGNYATMDTWKRQA